MNQQKEDLKKLSPLNDKLQVLWDVIEQLRYEDMVLAAELLQIKVRYWQRNNGLGLHPEEERRVTDKP